MLASTAYSGPKNRRIVFAFAGDSTMTNFLDISSFAIMCSSALTERLRWALAILPAWRMGCQPLKTDTRTDSDRNRSDLMDRLNRHNRWFVLLEDWI